VPPTLSVASHKVMGGPPETSIFLSFPPAKKPRKRLSGDQKGDEAPSVPAIACAVSASSERTHRRFLPSALLATKAIRRPSGETARRTDPTFWGPTSAQLSGGVTEKRTGGASSGARRKYARAPRASIALTMAIAPTDQATRALLRGFLSLPVAVTAVGGVARSS